MRRLTLVRHAKSAWDDPGLADFDRPLNARGQRDAPVMAQRLAALPRPPERLVSSPAVRALSTARVFAAALGVAESEVALEPAIYDASVGALMQVVRRLNPDLRHVLLFGHNPGFSQLARRLATCPFEEIPTCAIVSLELSIDAWTEADSGCGRLAYYLYPKDGAD